VCPGCAMEHDRRQRVLERGLLEKSAVKNEVAGAGGSDLFDGQTKECRARPSTRDPRVEQSSFMPQP
jgi:hypothetical protein